MKLLWNRWTEVQRKLKRSKDILWLFDYDGTLTPIVNHPDRAVLRLGVRSLLKKLVLRYPKRLGVLSGRTLQDLQRQVDISGLIYGAAHGFQWQGPGFEFKREPPPVARKQLSLLEHNLRNDFREIPGAWVEDKKWMVAVHYRETRLTDQLRIQAIVESAKTVAKWKGLTVQEGLKVLEIFSDSKWNKGEAVLWLKRKLRARHVFYVGDDTTDEDVFRALGANDITVHVGANAASLAQYQVPRQYDMNQLLRRILRL